MGIRHLGECAWDILPANDLLGLGILKPVKVSCSGSRPIQAASPSQSLIARNSEGGHSSAVYLK